jgi:light-regulated signal transduction histidine kinase (bacteriophytochrome)
MKPLLSGTQDTELLQDLGRASVQIVHDLKNQLNGLKLYATFLRKRIEKGERPADERETVTKLIMGLDRAANDLSAIVQYGRPLELRTQPGVDLAKLIKSVCESVSRPGADSDVVGTLSLEVQPGSCHGNYDSQLLTEALRSICVGALKIAQLQSAPKTNVVLARNDSLSPPQVTIEWRGISPADHDPFNSFAGSHELKMSLAARIIKAHGGSVRCDADMLVATLPLAA